VVPVLKASTYRIIAEATGMTGKIDHAELNAGQALEVNLAMSAAGVSATVNIVSAEETVVNNGSASMGASVIPREVEGLPVNGRQLSQLYLQAPGSVNSGSGTFGDIRFSGRATSRTSFVTTVSKAPRLSTLARAILTAKFPRLSACSLRSRTCRNSGSIQITIRRNRVPAPADR
jgi:hypothetical protein